MAYKPKATPSVDLNYTMPHFDPIINAKEYKQAFLKGDRESVYYLKPIDPNFTHYHGGFRGLQVDPKNKANIIDRFRTTCAGYALPDPQTVAASAQKFERYKASNADLS